MLQLCIFIRQLGYPHFKFFNFLKFVLDDLIEPLIFLDK